MKYKTLLGIIFFSLLIFNNCAVNPITGKKELSLMGEEKELQLGQSNDPKIVASYGLYESEALQNFINEKGQQMAKVSHRPNLPFNFRVLDSPVVNAFALPGGFVYFTRGILAHFNNEAEFAGVLGHEIGHITARHAADQYTKQILGQVGFMAGVIASREVAANAQQLSQAMQLMFLKFGRDDESESDQLGVEYSTKIGYDATHMANFFQTLKRLSDESGHSIPTFQSTHPDPVDRFQKVSEAAQTWQQKMRDKSFVEGRNSYLNLIDGLVYGEDPKQGFVQNDKFYHPELKFQFDLPKNWVVQNSPAQVQIINPDQKSGVILSIAQGDSPKAAGQAFAQSQKLQILQQEERTIHGNNAYSFYAEAAPDQNNPSNITSVYLTFIQYNGLIYQFMGISPKASFAANQPNFDLTMNSFKLCNDATILSKQPERIKIVDVPANATFQSVMSTFGIPAARHDEIAILNSMQLDDQLPKGMKIKIVK